MSGCAESLYDLWPYDTSIVRSNFVVQIKKYLRKIKWNKVNAIIQNSTNEQILVFFHIFTLFTIKKQFFKMMTFNL